MFTRIAVATDGSSTALRAVQVAADLAAKYEAEVIVLHVLLWEDPKDILKRLAFVQHIIDGEPEALAASDDVPVQTIIAELESRQLKINEKLITVLGNKVVEQAKLKCREYGINSVNVEILEGNYADQIVAAVKRTGADLVVLGARGLGQLEGLLQGSVSQAVAQKVDSTYLIVR
ncbi:MAG: universal stress protein [Rhodospirillaceae bacterium]|nr:universal stress protein [Rhodospirillaceae bacterium]MBL6930027.1 universal stress protein [Rhodospirillales bacterium]MBL6940949.1 universal stress protein [Rhodospirillales bacterium]